MKVSDHSPTSSMGRLDVRQAGADTKSFGAGRQILHVYGCHEPHLHLGLKSFLKTGSYAQTVGRLKAGRDGNGALRWRLPRFCQLGAGRRRTSEPFAGSQAGAVVPRAGSDGLSENDDIICPSMLPCLASRDIS